MVHIKTYQVPGYMFNHFYEQYLVLLTMAPRNSCLMTTITVFFCETRLVRFVVFATIDSKTRSPSPPQRSIGCSLTRKQINEFNTAIHTQESPPHKWFLVGCSSPVKRLAKHLTTPCAWCKQCLPGRPKPDVLHPGIAGMRGSMIIRLWPYMT